MYPPTDLESRSPKSRCQQDWLFLKVQRETVPYSNTSFWWLPAILGVLGLVNVLLQSLPESSHDLTLCVSYVLVCLKSLTPFSYEETNY